MQQYVPYDAPKPEGDEDLVFWMQEYYTRWDLANITSVMGIDALASSAVGRHSRVQQVQLNKFMRNQLNCHIPESREIIGTLISGVDNSIWKRTMESMLQFIASKGGFRPEAAFVK